MDINDFVYSYVTNEILSEQDMLNYGNLKRNSDYMLETCSVIAICEMVRDQLLDFEIELDAMDIVDNLKRQYTKCWRTTKNEKNRKTFQWMVEELEWIEIVVRAELEEED